jgi:hypothetical protein
MKIQPDSIFNLKSFVLIAFVALSGCDKPFEPDLSGMKASTIPARPRVAVEMNGRKKTVTLPGDDKIGYRFVQWTKHQHQLLLVQTKKTEFCMDFQIVLADTTGTIVDTIYTAPPNTPLNFKLAPNDSLMLVKSYDDDCGAGRGRNFRYTFLNRYSKMSMMDTIVVDNARGLLLPETVWSPDSKKVLVTQWYGPLVKAFVYDLAEKDTSFLDIATNFVWSPTDKNKVAYIQEYSIFMKNIKTGEKELIYEGRRKKRVSDFRFNPTGDFLRIKLRGYLLNVESNMLGTEKTMYLSLKDKTQSEVFYNDEDIDSWKR